MKIYIENFISKKGNFEPIPSGVYDADADRDNCYIIKGPDGQEHAVKLGSMDNDYFSCKVSKIASEEEVMEMVKEQTDKILIDIDDTMDQNLELLQEVIYNDITLLEPFKDLLLHIKSTQADKYEMGNNLLDLHGMKFSGSRISSGFNIGNASSYLKRYLTEGFDKSYKTEDLLKAIHFILFEIESRKNGI